MPTKATESDQLTVKIGGVEFDVPATLDDWNYKAARAYSSFVAAGAGMPGSIHAEQLLVELAGTDKATQIVRGFKKSKDAHEAVMSILKAYGDPGE